MNSNIDTPYWLHAVDATDLHWTRDDIDPTHVGMNLLWVRCLILATARPHTRGDEPLFCIEHDLPEPRIEKCTFDDVYTGTMRLAHEAAEAMEMRIHG